MMWINRIIKEELRAELENGQNIVVLFGARQVGKTSLLKKIIGELPYKALAINGDELKYIEVFSGRDLGKMEELIEGYSLLFIDEGQKISGLGIHLKILHDARPELRIVVTGSSSFDLATKVSEPLTGRKRVFNLFPVSVEELSSIYNTFELKDFLDDMMRFGLYPEVITGQSTQSKMRAIEEISNSYLMKDIIEIGQIQHLDKAYQLLKLLAFQIGSEVSVHELSQAVKLNHDTVESYISLFEKAFILFRVGGFSRNLRNEIKKSKKIYFWDLGIRNYLVGNFNTLDQRNDTGVLFENFIITERQKWLNYHRQMTNIYFWRLYTGSEIDYVEERFGKLFAYEIKRNKSKFRLPKTWIETYHSTVELINKTNFLSIDSFPIR